MAKQGNARAGIINCRSVTNPLPSPEGAFAKVCVNNFGYSVDWLFL